MENHPINPLEAMASCVDVTNRLSILILLRSAGSKVKINDLRRLSFLNLFSTSD